MPNSCIAFYSSIFILFGSIIYMGVEKEIKK